MSDKETAPPPDYNAAMAWLDKQFPHSAGPRAMTWAEIIACLALYKAEPVAVECTAPAPQPAKAIELLVAVRDYAITEDGLCPVCLADPHSPGCVIELVTNFVRELDDAATPQVTPTPDPENPSTWPEIGKAPASPTDVPDDETGEVERG